MRWRASSPRKCPPALGQQVIIDNRGGVAGVIGMRVAAKAAPDGYTIVMSHTGITSINPTLYANPGYDVKKEFTPIGLIATTPIVLMTNNTFPARTVGDLDRAGEARAGQAQCRHPAARHRGLPLRGTVQGGRRDRFHHRDLQGHRSPHQRSPGRPRADRLQRAGAGHGQPAGGNAASDRDRRADAARPAARRADHCGVRAARLRGRAALRPDGAGRHPGRGHRPPQQGTARDGGAARKSRPASSPTAATRCRRRRRNTPPTLPRRSRNGRP